MNPLSSGWRFSSGTGKTGKTLRILRGFRARNCRKRNYTILPRQFPFLLYVFRKPEIRVRRTALAAAKRGLNEVHDVRELSSERILTNGS